MGHKFAQNGVARKFLHHLFSYDFHVTRVCKFLLHDLVDVWGILEKAVVYLQIAWSSTTISACLHHWLGTVDIQLEFRHRVSSFFQFGEL